MTLTSLFSTVLDLTAAGSIAIVCVLLARLVLNRAPKWISYALWAVVLFRLLCPVSYTVELPYAARIETPQLAEYLQAAPAEQKSIRPGSSR